MASKFLFHPVDHVRRGKGRAAFDAAKGFGFPKDRRALCRAAVRAQTRYKFNGGLRTRFPAKPALMTQGLPKDEAGCVAAWRERA